MNYTEVKKICDEKIKEYPEYYKRYKKEIVVFKRFFKNGRDIISEFEEKKDRIDNRYVIPFLLGYTSSVDLSKEPEYIQVFPGASGGIDVDTDMSPAGREVLFNHLKEKFGEDRVLSVGTYSKLGLKSAIKDILRVYKVPFKESNDFTGKLDSKLSLEENLEMIRNTYPNLYKIYEKHKEIIDMSSEFDGKIRQMCLPYWVGVNTDNGYKEISKLNNEIDRIKYLDSHGDIKYTNRFNIINTGRQKYYKITLENGNYLEATENHKFFTRSGVKTVKTLSTEDEIISIVPACKVNINTQEV